MKSNIFNGCERLKLRASIDISLLLSYRTYPTGFILNSLDTILNHFCNNPVIRQVWTHLGLSPTESPGFSVLHRTSSVGAGSELRPLIPPFPGDGVGWMPRRQGSRLTKWLFPNPGLQPLWATGSVNRTKGCWSLPTTGYRLVPSIKLLDTARILFWVLGGFGVGVFLHMHDTELRTPVSPHLRDPPCPLLDQTSCA